MCTLFTLQGTKDGTHSSIRKTPFNSNMGGYYLAKSFIPPFSLIEQSREMKENTERKREKMKKTVCMTVHCRCRQK